MFVRRPHLHVGTLPVVLQSAITTLKGAIGVVQMQIVNVAVVVGLIGAVVVQGFVERRDIV